MESLESVSRILRRKNRHDIATLLVRAHVVFEKSVPHINLPFASVTTAEIYAPMSDYDGLNALSRIDEELILEAISENWPFLVNDREKAYIIYRLDPDSLNRGFDPEFPKFPDDTDEVLRTLDHLRKI